MPHCQKSGSGLAALLEGDVLGEHLAEGAQPQTGESWQGSVLRRRHNAAFRYSPESIDVSLRVSHLECML